MTVLLATPERTAEEKVQPATDWLRVILIANCGVLLAVAIFFRIWNLDRVPGVNGDEAWSGVVAVQILRGEPVAWRTPTGNLLNPFFLGPQVLLHSWFGPSFVLLRSVAVFSGLTAIVLNFVLCRKVFGLQVAVTSTVLLAVLPVNIAYSRFAWDSCQTVLATTVAIHLALMTLVDGRRPVRWSVLSVAALAIAVLIHPTNVFLTPMVVVPLGYRWRKELQQFWQTLLARWPRAITASACAIATAAAYALFPWLVLAAGRAVRPEDMVLFGQYYGQLFSGTTAYRFISGAFLPANNAAPSSNWLDFTFWATVAVLGYGVQRALRDDRRPKEVCLVLSYGLSVLGFYLIAGPAAIAPHFERYAMCLVAPLCVVGAVGLQWWVEQRSRVTRLAASSFVVIPWLLLGSFYFNYFRAFETTGGLSHDTFRTGGEEPKMAALGHVIDSNSGQARIRVLAGEWWNYWPLRYLALADPRVEVIGADADLVQAMISLPRDTGTWCIEFTGSEAHHLLKRLLAEYELKCPENVIFDSGGKPLLSVLGPLVRTTSSGPIASASN